MVTVYIKPVTIDEMFKTAREGFFHAKRAINK